MNSPFVHGKKSVLREWKSLRKRLTSERSDHEHLEEVMKFWNMTPITNRFMDWDSPERWPGAWEMIDANDYDDSMVSLAMFYSLLLSEDQRWDQNRLSLVLLRDRERCVQRLVLEIDQSIYLNLEYDRMVRKTASLGQACSVQQRYLYDGKKHLVLDHFSCAGTVKTNDNHVHAQLNMRS